MEKQQLKFLFVEGPAGSGKSTMIEKIMSLPGMGLVFPFGSEHMEVSLPRVVVDDQFAAAASLLKEEMYYLSVLMNPQDHAIRIFPRGPLSQLIYGSIRNSRPNPRDHEVTRAINSSMEFFEELRKQFYRKIKQDRPELEIFVNFLFMSPSIELLIQNREKAGKVYAFEPEIELGRYQAVYKSFVSTGLSYWVYSSRSNLDHDPNFGGLMYYLDNWNSLIDKGLMNSRRYTFD